MLKEEMKPALCLMGAGLWQRLEVLVEPLKPIWVDIENVYSTRFPSPEAYSGPAVRLRTNLR